MEVVEKDEGVAAARPAGDGNLQDVVSWLSTDTLKRHAPSEEASKDVSRAF